MAKKAKTEQRRRRPKELPLEEEFPLFYDEEDDFLNYQGESTSLREHARGSYSGMDGIAAIDTDDQFIEVRGPKRKRLAKILAEAPAAIDCLRGLIRMLDKSSIHPETKAACDLLKKARQIVAYAINPNLGGE